MQIINRGFNYLLLLYVINEFYMKSSGFLPKLKDATDL